MRDGWLTRFLGCLRFKLLDLPRAYLQLIRGRLEPGGAIVILEGGAGYLRCPPGEHSVFQVGGWAWPLTRAEVRR